MPVNATAACDCGWTDYEGFDCQEYEDAAWCTPQGDVGAGWCKAKGKAGRYQPNFPNRSCLDYVNYQFGWGTLKAFARTHGQYAGITASQVCKGCGAQCPECPKKRTPNAIPTGCQAFEAPMGGPWRDSWGYTCDSYRHGNFCVKTNGQWHEGGLWPTKDFGKITAYSWWAKNPANYKVNAYQACCACGGGSQPGR